MLVRFKPLRIEAGAALPIDKMDEDREADVAEKQQEDVQESEEWGPPEYYSSAVNVDEVLKELVERKSKLQSFTPFNLDYAVEVS